MHGSLTQLAGKSDVWDRRDLAGDRDQHGARGDANLTNPTWNGLTVNGGNPDLNTSEAIDLVDSNGDVIGAPSAPNSTTNDGYPRPHARLRTAIQIV